MMSTEQEQSPTSRKPAGKFGNRFLQEDRTLKIQSWAVLIILAIIIAGILILLGYLVGWTGFQGKTLWDWMQLFLVSTVLGAGAYWFNFQQTTHQQTLAEQQQKQEKELAEQQQKQEKELAEQREQAMIFDAYLDRMKELLLDRDLLDKDQRREEVRLVARTQTLTTLRRLKGGYISMLFTFLQDANLNRAIIKPTIIVEASIIDFQKANLRQIDLHGANLSGADLSGADLSEANLSGATLRGATLRKAKLCGANLSEVGLYGADLRGANLCEADLCGAKLHNAWLHKADLSQAKLRNATLRGAKLCGAKLHKADLCGAKLHNADLSEAEGMTTEELVSQADSLEGATLPNGTRYQKGSATDSTQKVPQASILDESEEELPQGAPIGSGEEFSQVPETSAG
jgi:uncharacterized protein YjbI with pentapeptide repeats